MGSSASSLNDLVKGGNIQKLQDHLNKHPNDVNKKDSVSYAYIKQLQNSSLLFDCHHQ